MSRLSVPVAVDPLEHRRTLASRRSQTDGLTMRLRTAESHFGCLERASDPRADPDPAVEPHSPWRAGNNEARVFEPMRDRSQLLLGFGVALKLTDELIAAHPVHLQVGARQHHCSRSDQGIPCRVTELVVHPLQ